METALSTISILPQTKEELFKFSRMLKDEIIADDKETLPILGQLKVIEKIVKDVLEDKDVKKRFLTDRLRYSDKEVVKFNGLDFTIREVGVKYDYDASGDTKWMDLDKKIKELTEARKEREKFLQNLPIEGTVDPDGGNYIIRPPKTSETMVIVKI
jgi:acetone carboxylase gamma subunit